VFLNEIKTNARYVAAHREPQKTRINMKRPRAVRFRPTAQLCIKRNKKEKFGALTRKRENVPMAEKSMLKTFCGRSPCILSETSHFERNLW